MSGIAGVIRFDDAPVAPGTVEAMTAAMAHRGPDRIGHWISGGVALGQCMLRTTPESLEETQPLADEDERLVLVMDGRIDNREALRFDLRAAGARLRDRSDAELVLRAYDRWGEDCLRRLEGDFALVIWDAARRAAFCARDQLGARPFHYHWDGRRLVFASELHPVLALPWVPEELNEGMVAEILANDRISRAETLWCGVRRLVAAHRMVVDEGRARIEEYWTPDLAAEIRYRRDAEYVDHYRALLEEAVRRHSRSHRPIACEVSGGIDSTAVFAVSEHLRRTGSLPAPGLEGATLRFSGGSAADEIDYARAVGTHLGRKIREIDAFLPPIDWYVDWVDRTRDFPPAPNSAMGLSLLEDASARGIRTVLTGQGGDEWQTGTRHYYADFFQDLSLDQIAASYIRDCRYCGVRNASYWLARYGVFPYLPPSGQNLVRAVSAGLRGRPPDVSAWLRPDLKALLEQRKRHPESPCPAVTRERHRDSLGMLRSATRAHFREASNALAASVGVEKRDPLNSLALVQFHFATPEHIRLRADQSRITHRKAVTNLAPSDVMDRAGKAEFSSTVRPHLTAFDRDGALGLSNAASGWIDQTAFDRYLSVAKNSNREGWPLWALWGLLGCVLVRKGCRFVPDKSDVSA